MNEPLAACEHAYDGDECIKCGHIYGAASELVQAAKLLRVAGEMAEKAAARGDLAEIAIAVGNASEAIRAIRRRVRAKVKHG